MKTVAEKQWIEVLASLGLAVLDVIEKVKPELGKQPVIVEVRKLLTDMEEV